MKNGLREWFIYRKPVKLLDGDFMIDLHFQNGFLSQFTPKSLEDFYACFDPRSGESDIFCWPL